MSNESPDDFACVVTMAMGLIIGLLIVILILVWRHN